MIKNKKKLLFLCLLVILIATAYISFVTGTIKINIRGNRKSMIESTASLLPVVNFVIRSLNDNLIVAQC
jgi:hypothetical protein